MTFLKETILISFILLSSTIGHSQTYIKKMMTDTLLSCTDIAENAHRLIPQYYHTHNIDSLDAIIAYWLQECDLTEKSVRLNILLSIELNEFTEAIYDTNIINDLIYFKRKSTANKDFFYFDNNYYLSKLDTIDAITKDWAEKLLKQNIQYAPIERFYLDLYAHNFTNKFQELKQKTFNNTLVQKRYYDKINELETTSQTRFEILFGYWFPTNQLNHVGPKPNLGIRVGATYKRWIADLDLNLKFGRTLNAIQINKFNTKWYSDFIIGCYIGASGGFELIQAKKHKLDLMGGLGFDVLDFYIDELSTNDEGEEEYTSKTLASFNLNTELSYKYNFDAWQYIGFNIKYNFLRYNNTRGTGLNGNAIIFSILYGVTPYDRKDEYLENLDYY